MQKLWSQTQRCSAPPYDGSHPYIATTIIGMCELEVVKQNVAALDFEIPNELLQKINHKIRRITPSNTLKIK
ncbi:hypothetical protein [Algoriphagus boritolerans]|uniref:hypothetical protein n=1 Tax=Algoriphagus boritolerans TaxID=308111 RepID=UPI001F28EB17|nr:hypothetical protein [Algoriphagus boritolerans]